MEFLGYIRENGSVGTRNYVGIISTVVCANEVAEAIGRNVLGTAVFTHHQGCCQTSVDISRINKVLAGLGANPNIFSVILVSLGCESTLVTEVQQAIELSKKRVETISIQDIGGATKSIEKGCILAQEMVSDASHIKRETFPVSEIILGLKCGSSDTTSGLMPNPALGIASDLLVEKEGTSIIGEVTEFIGAEHLLVQHAKNEKVGGKIIQLVDRMEERAKSAGVDIRGGQPTLGNIKGGLTTIEEKSIGAISKAGSSTINAVYEYGIAPKVKGLVVMDSPGREPEILTGLASAGCNVIAFTTGRGAPQGFPFVPVIKITGNENTANTLKDHIDIDVSSIVYGRESLSQAGSRIYQVILDVASGRLTKAEITKYSNSMDIYITGPVI